VDRLQQIAQCRDLKPHDRFGINGCAIHDVINTSDMPFFLKLCVEVIVQYHSRSLHRGRYLRSAVRYDGAHASVHVAVFEDGEEQIVCRYRVVRTWEVLELKQARSENPIITDQVDGNDGEAAYHPRRPAVTRQNDAIGNCIEDVLI
jgi:hypothetical protein